MKPEKNSINKSGHTLVWDNKLLVYVGIVPKEIVRSAGGIILEDPEQAKNNLLCKTEGVVIEIGDKCFDGSCKKPKIKDLVCFPMHSASSVVEGDDGAMYFVLKDTSVNTIHTRK